SYQYSGGRLLHGLPFADNDLGFAQVTKTDDDTQIQEVLRYRQDVPFQRRLTEHIVRLASGELLRDEQFDHQYRAPYPGVDWVAVQSRKISYYEEGQHVRDESVTWTYDALGGATSRVDCAGSECIKTDTRFTHDIDGWLLARVDEK